MACTCCDLWAGFGRYLGTIHNVELRTAQVYAGQMVAAQHWYYVRAKSKREDPIPQDIARKHQLIDNNPKKVLIREPGELVATKLPSGTWS